MARVDSGLVLKLPITCLLVLLFSSTFLETSAFTFTASIGRPYHGSLVNGIPFPNQFQGYSLRDQERSYTTPEVIGTVLDAIEAVREHNPDTCDLFFGDFSSAGGGWINMHRSHQNGRDADLGMYAKGNHALDTFVPMNEGNLDIPKTWCFVESLLRSQHVQYIFVDRRIQKCFYDYALSRGADRAYLDTLFGNGNFRNGIIQHVPHHYDHMHVRFYTPWSTMAARVGDDNEQKRTVIEMAQQAYLPKQVNYYVKGNERGLEALAQSFGVAQKDLCRWNQMHLNDVLSPGSCVVFYKRSFEMEPVNLARSLQPDSVPDSPAIQVASAGASESLSDAPTAVGESSSREKKLALSSSPIYTAHRGDTLEKVAKRTGMDLKVLCELNGLKPRAGVKPGQKIKLVSSKSTSGNANAAKSDAIKSVHAVSIADPKAFSSFAPAVYTVERQDTLSKIAKQQGLDLNALCQINGLNKNTRLKPGQKIKLLEQDVPQKKNPAPVVNASLGALSKRSTSSPSTLQANMKSVRDSKTKASTPSQKKSQGIQKTSAKASSSGSGAPVVKAEKNPKKKPQE